MAAGKIANLFNSMRSYRPGMTRKYGQFLQSLTLALCFTAKKYGIELENHPVFQATWPRLSTQSGINKLTFNINSKQAIPFTPEIFNPSLKKKPEKDVVAFGEGKEEKVIKRLGN